MMRSSNRKTLPPRPPEILRKGHSHRPKTGCSRPDSRAFLDEWAREVWEELDRDLPKRG